MIVAAAMELRRKIKPGEARNVTDGFSFTGCKGAGCVDLGLELRRGCDRLEHEWPTAGGLEENG